MRIADLAWVRVISIRDQRRTHTSLAARHGTSLEVLSERLGHERVSTTADVYRMVHEDEREAAVDLSELRGKRSKPAA